MGVAALGHPASTHALSWSRFQRTIHFPDYDAAELLAIYEQMSAAGRYRMTAGARRALVATLAAQPRDKGFGNGRLVRNLFEATLARAREAIRLRPYYTPREQARRDRAEDRAARRVARTERRLGRKTERAFKRLQRRQDREQTRKAAACVVWPEREGGRR